MSFCTANTPARRHPASPCRHVSRGKEDDKEKKKKKKKRKHAPRQAGRRLPPTKHNHSYPSTTKPFRTLFTPAAKRARMRSLPSARLPCHCSTQEERARSLQASHPTAGLEPAAGCQMATAIAATRPETGSEQKWLCPVFRHVPTLPRVKSSLPRVQPTKGLERPRPPSRDSSSVRRRKESPRVEQLLQRGAWSAEEKQSAASTRQGAQSATSHAPASCHGT